MQGGADGRKWSGETCLFRGAVCGILAGACALLGLAISTVAGWPHTGGTWPGIETLEFVGGLAGVFVPFLSVVAVLLSTLGLAKAVRKDPGRP